VSLQPSAIPPVPEQTAAVARAAFRKPPLCVHLRDELGTLYADADFAALFPARGQPALPPWRLAVVTVLQFLEGLSDRQAADAVRARIDWKYALSLDLADSGFDYSVLSEFRRRLVAGGQEQLLLDRLLARLAERGLVKARGRQRTDSTHVLTAVRALNRLELVAEAMRAALNAVAAAAPDWLRAVAPPEWHRRYDRRVEDTRLPSTAAARERYGREVGADGAALLAALDAPTAPPRLRDLPAVAVLRRVWARHYDAGGDRAPADEATPEDDAAGGETGTAPRFRADRELARAAYGIESPYDADARYRRKRATAWTGYMVHVSETCDPGAPRLVTHVDTTPATAHEATRLDAIHAALAAKGLPPGEHLADAAYISAALLVRSAEAYGVAMVGPPRPDPTWQRRAGGYTADAFRIDWGRRQAVCPEGRVSAHWHAYAGARRDAYVKVRFAPADCRACPARAGCVRSATGARQLLLHPPAQHAALAAARARQASPEGRRAYALRAGVEGTLSQAVRAFGLRRARYRGLPKTLLQHAATAAALNLARLDAWLAERPLAPTRVSRFARLAA
jgi:transposase